MLAQASVTSLDLSVLIFDPIVYFDTEGNSTYHEATQRIRQLIFGQRNVSAGRAAA